MSVPSVLVLAWLASACTDAAAIVYPWDERGVLCAASIDDYREQPRWSVIEDSLDEAAAGGGVAQVYAHEPGATVSLATIERVLDLAAARGLPTLTYRDLDTLAPRAGLALAFDDNAPGAWLLARDLLASRGAHVTFFVSRWTYLTDEERAQIRLLASDGHDLQPHSVNHIHGLDYVRDHGMAAYVADEVLPSCAVLEAEGYPATTFAYPFGERDAALDAAVLDHVAHVRTTLGPCPY